MFALLVLRPSVVPSTSKHSAASPFLARAFVRMASTSSYANANASNGGGSSNKLRIVTYNVLTPNYATPRDLPVRVEPCHFDVVRVCRLGAKQGPSLLSLSASVDRPRWTPPAHPRIHAHPPPP